MRRESSFEKAFESLFSWWAKYHGMEYKYVKTVTPGRKGWPDRLLLLAPHGRHIYIEWKRKGEVPDAMQLHIHNELRALGAEVHWYDDHLLAMDSITEELRPKTRANSWDEVDSRERWRSAVLKARQGQNGYGS